MSLRPIDMQVTLPRVSEIKEAKQTFLHKADAEHQSANAQVQKEMLKKKESVVKASSGSKTDARLKRKDGNSEKNKEQDGKQKKDGNQKRRGIDIRI